jgi:hypothetical protein
MEQRLPFICPLLEILKGKLIIEAKCVHHPAPHWLTAKLQQNSL